MKSGNSKNSRKELNGKHIFIKRFSLEREYYFYQEYFNYKFLNGLELEITPKLIGINKKDFKLYFEFIEQFTNDIKNKNKQYESLTIKLIKKIKEQSIEPKLYAKEALLDCSKAINEVKNRLNAHKNNISNQTFDYQEIIIKFERLFTKQEAFLRVIKPTSNLTFSHADSSINNSIIDGEGKLKLVDLEYAGLDSPIKQHIDYLLHPKNSLFSYNSQSWTDFFLNILINKKDQINLNIYNSFFALKWGLIVLNEFLPQNWTIRLQADSSREDKYDKILELQLKKANIYLEASKKLLDNVPPQKLFKESDRLLLFKSY